jgi:hypothetical protein
LPLGEYVYRAVTLPNGVKNKQAKNPAFYRRWRYKPNGEERRVWDEKGLSFGTSVDAACQGLETAPEFVLKLSVEQLRIRNVQFDEPDETGHLNATNVPFDRPEERGALNLMASLMCECVEECIPMKPTPDRTDASGS